jgi:hypothetical protein
MMRSTFKNDPSRSCCLISPKSGNSPTSRVMLELAEDDLVRLANGHAA